MSDWIIGCLALLKENMLLSGSFSLSEVLRSRLKVHISSDILKGHEFDLDFDLEVRICFDSNCLRRFPVSSSVGEALLHEQLREVEEVQSIVKGPQTSGQKQTTNQYLCIPKKYKQVCSVINNYFSPQCVQIYMKM